jgi:peptidoglycan/xylan/chitin deacetylase (PgdA/CDA1 family)
MNFLKILARRIGFPFLLSSNAIKVYLHTSKPKTLIVMYHGIIKQHTQNISVNHLPISEFEKQIRYLSSNFKMIKLSEAFSNHIHEPKREEFSIAVTFDDGYENNFTNAFPVLQKYGVPATIFTVTGQLENPEFMLWYDLIDFAKLNFPLSFFVSKINAAKLNHIPDEIKSWNDLKSFLKKLNDFEKKAVLDFDPFELNKIISDTPEEYYKLLNIQQMKTMIDSGLIEMGSHTHTHPNLDILSDKDLIFQLTKPKEILEESLGVKINSIAFPDGAYNDKVKSFAREVGYNMLLSVDSKIVSDRMEQDILPRFCISNTTTAESNLVQIYMNFKKKGF